MRIVLVCNDTRGGVQPYVALARGLRAAGHDVRAVAPAALAPMFEGVGVPVQALSGDVQAAVRASGGAAERGALASLIYAARQLPAVMESWMRETLEGCEGAALIAGGIGGMGTGVAVAEALGVPFVEAHLQPLGQPTDAYPAVLAPWLPRALGSGVRRASHRVSEAVLWGSMAAPVARARRTVLGQRRAPRAHLGQPVLYGFSPAVVQVPDEGPRRRHTTGYWTLPPADDWTPPADLAAFLAADGPPVVSVGFGSMVGADPALLAELVRGAARDAGVRVVLLAGWGGLETGRSDDAVFAIEAVPHEWLFARVAATVHHGGAGTTGAALRAGVPTVVVPFTMDQPFWGARVAELGVGPAPIPRRRLTRAGLAVALRVAVTDRAMRARAAALGERLRAEDGVGEAVRRFGDLMDRRR
jgi:sterol 3beta-glucosyltransferase